MNTKCQVFTPPDYVEKLLNIVGYRSNLYGKRILENSCGDGNILVAIVKRYIEDCRHKGISDEKIRKGLSKDIIGYEIDPKQVALCVDNLNKVLNQHGIDTIKWQIYQKDYLRSDIECLYDYIIGNPPYITYSEMRLEDQNFLRSTYKSCEKGKFDYCYAFIDKSISELSADGKMAYLIPSSIFKTVFGQNLRDIMKPYIQEIIEYTRSDIFDDALVKPAIVLLEKDKIGDRVLYSDSNGKKKRAVSIDRLAEKWMFSDVQGGSRRFGDYFKVSHVVATLLNRAYVLEDGTYKETGKYYLVDGYHIEKDVVRRTATPRTKQFNLNELIVFPYYYNEGNLCKYSVEEFEKNYPGAVSYLKQFRNELAARKSDKSAKWFEYGRSQALGKLDVDKLLISTIISKEVVAYMLPSDCIPYAGMFVVPVDREDKLTLQDAYNILKSDDFFGYAQNIGIHINGNSVRVTSKDIENYMIKERD